MALRKKSPTLIIKPNPQVPDWRKLQVRLGSWESLDKKKPGNIDPLVSVEEQYSSAELEKIAKAAHYTKKLEIDMNDTVNDEDYPVKGGIIV